jgi:hypothetical protein
MDGLHVVFPLYKSVVAKHSSAGRGIMDED